MTFLEQMDTLCKMDLKTLLGHSVKLFMSVSIFQSSIINFNQLFLEASLCTSFTITTIYVPHLL